MSRLIRTSLCAIAAMCLGLPAAADDTGFEVITLGEFSDNDADFGLISLRVPLAQSTAGSERTAATGLRLRLDMTRSTYVTGYDSVTGEGKSVGYRLLMSYGMALSDTSTLTLIGGMSKRQTEVRPSTLNSPDDTDDTGLFVAAELEVNFSETGDLQVLMEHDATSGTYGAVTYLHELGALRLGPTFSIYSEDEYSQKKAGLVAAIDVAEDTEMRVTAARGESSLNGISIEDLSSVQVQLRFAF